VRSTLVPELSISSVVATSRCPVRFSIEKNKAASESFRYTLTKQVSYHLGEEINEEVVWEEACLVHDHPDHSLKPFLSEMVRFCGKKKDWRIPRESDLRVSAERYRIHGVVDRLFEDEPYFAIVRSSGAPAHGVYAADRLRITGYTICLQEMLGGHIRGGSIEYIPSGDSRFVTVEPRDKRKFLAALHEARRIMNGGFPRRPLRPPCTHCPYSSDCEPGGGTRLSEIL
jgi:CRISPR/Cas system-associated exonuclease Cas4 (RecB family)